MEPKEPLSRSVLITGVVVPLALGVMAIGGNLLTARLQPSATPAETPPSPGLTSEPQQTTGAPAIVDMGTGGGHDVAVNVGATANVSSGKVFIALTEIRTEKESSHNTLYATLSSDDPGVKDWRLKNVDAGFSGTFNGFKVRVMSVEPSRASFRVTPLPVDAVPTPTSGPRH